MSTVSEREVGGVRLLVGDKVRLWAVVSHRRHVGILMLCVCQHAWHVSGAISRLRSVGAFAVGLPRRSPISTLAGSYPWLGELGLAYNSHGYGEACGSVLMATWNADLCLSFLRLLPGDCISLLEK